MTISVAMTLTSNYVRLKGILFTVVKIKYTNQITSNNGENMCKQLLISLQCLASVTLTLKLIIKEDCHIILTMLLCAACF